MWTEETSRGNETAKVHDRIATWVSGRGLDIGAGFWPLKTDRTQDNCCTGMDFKDADICGDVRNLSMFTDEAFDYVYSSHALEDMLYTEATLVEWWRLVKVGGRLILYLPLTKTVAKAIGRTDWEGFYPNIGEQGYNINHQHDLAPAEVTEMMGRVGDAELELDEIRGEGEEYSFLQIYRKRTSSCLGARGIEVTDRSRRALLVRYGAIGDLIQTTPVLRKLKEDGYHVTFNTTSYAQDVIKNNPHVDELALQLRDYVPNRLLDSYWKDIAKPYAKFINLSGSAEGELLIPDSRMLNMCEDLKKQHPELSEQNLLYNVLQSIDRQVGKINYYDNHLKKAGYSDTGLNGELFFSEGEELIAQGFRARYPNKFMVLWSLSGSSYHKMYPYFGLVAQELLLKHPNILMITVGDTECQLMERGETANYLPRAGKWPLRSSLAMTKYVDLVIGPETGILNAAGCFDTPKITLLSHSSHDNLCKYWKNDYCLAPESTPEANIFCYPCHVLHYTHPVNGKPCPSCLITHTLPEGQTIPYDGKTGGMWTCPYVNCLPDDQGMGAPFPLCQAKGIPPARVLARINEVYQKWKSKKAGLISIAQ